MPVISVEHLSKSYRLGQINTGTFSRDLEAWWARLRGRPNPHLRIGETDHGNRDGEELWALKDVSFTVEQGEVLGIIGRNGAGKSTLLKILSRVTAPTSGRIRVKGRVASLLEVGTGFHPELTGRENVYLNGAILGMTRQEVTRKFDEIVDFAGVEKFIDTPVKRYSSGMYVRLAFAVAAHLDPEILVVDEVLAVGDAEFQKKCLGKMGEVAQGGRTVLFVSHNMAAVQNLCRRGLLIKNGRAIYFDEISKCVDEYLNFNNSHDLPQFTLPIQSDVPIQLDYVKVVNEDNEATGVFSFYEPVRVLIGLRVHSRISRIYVAFHVQDNEQQTLLFSRNFESNIDALSKDWLPGIYVYSLQIPGYLLTPATYRLSVHVASSLPAKIISGADRVCPFDIVDTGSVRMQAGFPWVGKVSFFPEWVLRET